MARKMMKEDGKDGTTVEGRREIEADLSDGASIKQNIHDNTVCEFPNYASPVGRLLGNHEDGDDYRALITISNEKTARMTVTNNKEDPFLCSNFQQFTADFDEDPLFFPGFGPQQSRECLFSDNGMEITPPGEEGNQPDHCSRYSDDDEPHSVNWKRRTTRSLTRKMNVKEKVAEDTWGLGKKLGMFAEDEASVIKELANDLSTEDPPRPKTRGRPRKTKH